MTLLNQDMTGSHLTLYSPSKTRFVPMSHTLLLIVSSCYHFFLCVSTLPVYLLLGLVCVLVALETCCELPQIKRLTHRFHHENVRELDPETTNIISRDHLADQLSDPSDHVTAHHSPVISSVSEQAASLRQDKSMPYIPVSGSAVNGKLT